MLGLVGVRTPDLTTRASERTLQASLNAKKAKYGGNHRKAMVQGLDESLKRMKLDYVDILYVHAWDSRTPVEETMRYTDGHSLASTADRHALTREQTTTQLCCRALDDMVRSGKALYVAVSDTPAWVIATANNTAKLRGWRCALISSELVLITRTCRRLTNVLAAAHVHQRSCQPHRLTLLIVMIMTTLCGT
jgi:aryl-alcohol dehydrogenase-like predicted oxidoreductase